MLNPVSWFTNLSPELSTFLISMIPLTELRASIPIGILVYELPVWKVWLIAVVGDLVPALCILFFAPIMHTIAIKYRLFGAVFTKILKRAENKFAGKHAKYGALALVLFVGIPLPMTGSWTGSLAAFVFNIPFKKSWPLILAGICIAATIVTLLTLFAGELV